jgi:hypothetical protein
MLCHQTLLLHFLHNMEVSKGVMPSIFLLCQIQMNDPVLGADSIR